MDQCCPPERTLASLVLSVMATAFSLTHSLHRSHPERTETRQNTGRFMRNQPKPLHSWQPSKGFFHWGRSRGEIWMFAADRMLSWLWLQEHCATIIMAASELYTKVNTHSASNRVDIKCWCQRDCKCKCVNAMPMPTYVWKWWCCWCSLLTRC